MEHSEMSQNYSKSPTFAKSSKATDHFKISAEISQCDILKKHFKSHDTHQARFSPNVGKCFNFNGSRRKL